MVAMSQPESSEHRSKKRKHTSTVTEGGPSEPSAKRPKALENRSKEAKKKDKKERNEKKGKGKAKAAADDAQFKVISASLSLSIPPIFASNLRAGAEEMLDSMVMRYVPAFQGVLLAHDNLDFLDSRATIKADCPFANCRVAFDATVWSPHIGTKLVGKINLCSPDHISLLIHRTFNVSIPRQHIPTDSWDFEYGPAENDPEFGAGVDLKDPASNQETDGEAEGVKEEEEGREETGVERSGRWVHNVTATTLGGKEGFLEFTVIGLTVANRMLSLVGSIQQDPFAEQYWPEPEASSSNPSQTQPSQSQSRTQPSQPGVQVPDDLGLSSDDSENEEDTFGLPGKVTAEKVKKEEEERKAQLEAEEVEKRKKRNEKKRKRKEREDEKNGNGKGDAREGKRKKT